MNYSNIVELSGAVTAISFDKTGDGTEMRLALKTATDLGWETTILCVRRFGKDEKIPKIRKGNWIAVFGTLRITVTPKGKQQAYVLMIDPPEAFRGRYARIPYNYFAAGGRLHAWNHGNFGEEALEAGFLLQSVDPQFGYIYEYSCVIPRRSMKNFLDIQSRNERFVIRGSLMMLYDPEDDESSSCCIIARKHEPFQAKHHS